MENSWNPTCYRFVAFLDIMGFRDLVYRKPHQKVLDVMEEFKKPINKIESEAVNATQGKYGWNTFNKTIVKPTVFSDSVLLSSSDGSIGSFKHIIWDTKMIITHALIKGVPIKGAIAYGKQTSDPDHSLFVGKPLIDAYELQNELVIYGVALHHTAEKRFIEKYQQDKFEEQFGITQYLTPLKQGQVMHYLIDIVDKFNLPKTTTKLQKELPHLYCNVSGSSRKYVDNTISFFKERDSSWGEVLNQ